MTKCFSGSAAHLAEYLAPSILLGQPVKNPSLFEKIIIRTLRIKWLLTTVKPQEQQFIMGKIHN
ncbi:hypothetical protein NIES593_20000 [Hydrococcus rivularis NIES-593]|uniref:Uncharacterized protein n=1 Tax=Hydrococcus rivularis NIES-593 TaxID=1921803 RepID=A0A1U7H909_9CYAN|nr:hypothetical protein NIES593_20000 [Hydrococcus rivularis NIES-593]